MTLRRAQLIPDTLQPSGDGVTGAQIAAVLIEGETHRAYVKMLPAEHCAAEAFCALLLKTWGLSVPEPVLVEHEGSVWFGSLDAEYPSLKQRFQINRNWPEEVMEALENSKYYKWLTYIFLPCHLASLVAQAATQATTQPPQTGPQGGPQARHSGPYMPGRGSGTGPGK